MGVHALNLHGTTSRLSVITAIFFSLAEKPGDKGEEEVLQGGTEA